MTPPPPTPDPTPKADSGAGATPRAICKNCGEEQHDQIDRICMTCGFAMLESVGPNSLPTPPQSDPALAAAEAMYPCEKCGTLRTEAEGGTVFTVCDKCWDEIHRKPLAPAPAPEGRGETGECPMCGGGGIISSGPRGERRYGGGRRCPACVGSGKVTKPNASGATPETDAAVIHVRGMGTVVAAGKMAAMERERDEARAENKVLTTKNRASLANNLCPDHRDKQFGKPCLACEIERLTSAHAAAVAQAQALREAATALVERIKLIHDHPLYQSVWLCAHNHGVSYATGPTYEMELKALSAALAASEAGK